MNGFWIVIAVLFSANLTTSDPVYADGALKHVEIFRGINSQRQLDKPGTIEQEYLWNFDNKSYTVLMAIDNKWYNRNRGNKRQKRRGWDNFDPMVREGTKALQDLVREFNQVMPQTWHAEQKVNFVLAFVQSLPYTPDKVTTGYDEFYRYAIETLVEGGGDCEDTSVLFASILSGLGFEVALIIPPRHLAVGIKGNFRGAFVSYKNNNYYYCETTGKGWQLGQVPKDYKNKRVDIIPIVPESLTPAFLPSKQVNPRVNPPVPPRTNLSPIMLVKGINQFETEQQYEKAIESFKYALDRDGLNSEQRALAQLYWGCSELARTNRTEPNYNNYVREAREKLSKVFRYNPDQKLPPRLHSKKKFRTLFEGVRDESIGELIVISSLPQTEIWIHGNGIKRKNLGTGTVSVRLFKGNYTVEAVYEGVPQNKELVEIKPDGHEKLNLKIPPIMKHKFPSEVSVGKEILLTFDLISYKRPEQVKIHYKIYDRDDNEIEWDNENTRLWNEQPALSKWTYRGSLPSQKRVGSLKFYIEAEYEDSPAVRHPKNRYRYYQISVVDRNAPTIDLLNPIKVAKVNGPIKIEANVTDNTSVKWVRVHYTFSRSKIKPSLPFSAHQYLKEDSSDVYIIAEIQVPETEAGYIWYYLIASDKEGRESPPPKEENLLHIQVKDDERDRKKLIDELEDIENDSGQIREANSREQRQINGLIEAAEKEIKFVDNTSNINKFNQHKNSVSEQLSEAREKVKALEEKASDDKNKLDELSSSVSKVENSAKKRLHISYSFIETETESVRNKIKKTKKVLSQTLNDVQTRLEEQENQLETVIQKFKPLHKGIWTSRTLSDNVFKNSASVSNWGRGDVLSLAYLYEGKDRWTLGAQLDFSDQDPALIKIPYLNSVTCQLGYPPLRGIPIVLTMLFGGVAEYRRSDSFILGLGLKGYLGNRVAIDATSSIGRRSQQFYFYHYEVGIRCYIYQFLNLRVDGRRYLGDRSTTEIRMGLGITF